MILPICLTWPITPGATLAKWQDGRCGFCGMRAEVMDHDHETGLERGLLCRGCNRTEGTAASAAWAAWRDGSNPASLLGIKSPYVNVHGRAPVRFSATDHQLEQIAAVAVGCLPGEVDDCPLQIGCPNCPD